jgi:hypothetical protein
MEEAMSTTPQIELVGLGSVAAKSAAGGKGGPYNGT